MHSILTTIEKKRQKFSELPLFGFMQDKRVSPIHRLAFAPCATQFIMNFADLNRFAFRVEPTTDSVQEIINKHTYVDEHHWHWFLEDLEKLGFNHQENVTETLRFLWSEECRVSRQVANELYRLTFKAMPIQKLAAMEAIEAAGNVMFAVSSQVVQEITATSLDQQEYRYFGGCHLVAETGHTYGSSEAEALIKNLQLTDLEEQECVEIVEQVFSIFAEFTDELLAYAQQHPPKNSSAKDHARNVHRREIDYLIIGAGPAGIQLGYFLEKANRNYLILEAGESPATSFKQFPRHRQLISINKPYTGYDDPEINLRWDWNSLLSDDENLRFTKYSKDYFPNADTLVKYLGDFVEHFNLKVQYNAKVAHITRNGNFQVTDESGCIFSCKRLIMATGVSKPYVPQIPGIELAENYTDVSVYPESFQNQRVLIIGKGNSGFETADNLVSTTAFVHIASPHPINFAWRSKYVGHLRAVNNNLLDTYHLKSQNAILDASIVKIEKRNNQFVVSVSYTHANAEQEELIYDRVIVCTGFRFDSSIFDESCQPKLTINNRFPEQTSEWESVNVPGLYFAGVLMHMRDFKKKASGFIHGFRYNIRALHFLFEEKYHRKPWPCQLVDSTSEGIAEAIIQQINKSSALWQQTGFLCDLIIVPGQGEAAHYYAEIPTDYVHDSRLGEQDHYYVVTLEFGNFTPETAPDPFAIQRVHKEDVDNASKSLFLHPIIRHYCGATLIAEHHIIEDLAGEWKEEVHIKPLTEFLRGRLSNREKRLGTYLLEAGLVTSEQLEIALKEQKDNPMLLGHLLSKKGWVNQQTIEYLVENVILPPRQVARLERELTLKR
jgi:thioredoxin reductase